MKPLRIFQALLAAVVLMMLPSVSVGGTLSEKYPVMLVDYTTGWGDVKLPTTFTFGVTAPDGTCSTVDVTDENVNSAYRNVQDLCPDCRVENITRRIKYGQAYWNDAPLAEKYCEPEK